MVASGSLPPGVPVDFYARLVRLWRERGARPVLDAAPPVPVVSAVGAGDSFVGHMVWALQSGQPLMDAFASGVTARFGHLAHGEHRLSPALLAQNPSGW